MRIFFRPALLSKAWLAVVATLLVLFPVAVSRSAFADDKPIAADGANVDAKQVAEREEAFAKMLSGATLEGSFTQTGPGGDPKKLDREKYTLGEVKKVAGNVWLFPARIEYGGKDVTLPIMLPVHWAGDTPVVVVDTVDLPGLGSVSARVLFFAGHYAGYWKHGEHSGNLFGLIHSAPAKVEAGAKAIEFKPSSGNKPPAREQPQK
jgi:hypothetical protein